MPGAAHLDCEPLAYWLTPSHCTDVAFPLLPCLLARCHRRRTRRAVAAVDLSTATSLMRFAIPAAIVLGSALIAGAIVYHARQPRFALGGPGMSAVERLDTRSGTVTWCMPERSADGAAILYRCDGKMAPIPEAELDNR
jgi:hypothetical protein